MEMSRIEIITSMYRLAALKHALSKIGVHGMTVLPVSYTHLTLPTKLEV